MKVVAVHSQKGGVGKTSTALNLAHKGMSFGFETLLIDLDAQGSLSYLLGQGGSEKLRAREWLAADIDWNQYIEATAYSGVSLLPARKGLRKLDRLMANTVSTKHLKRLLKPLRARFDLVIIDCPAGINTVTGQAYVAADLVLVPLSPTPLCLQSYRDLIAFTRDTGVDPDKLAPFFNRVNPRLALHRECLIEFAEEQQSPPMSWVRATTVIEQMGSSGRAVTETHSEHPVSRDINELWKAVVRRLDLHH